MIKITLKGGAVVQYPEVLYTSYTYDSKCFLIYRDALIIGIYNIDAVRSIEILDKGV